MPRKQIPWWADPKLTPAQKDARAEAIAWALADAWLGLPKPKRGDIALARSIARQKVANPFPLHP